MSIDGLRVKVVSDVHLEFYEGTRYPWLRQVLEQDCDVLAVCGDLGWPFNAKGKPNARTLDFLRTLRERHEHVLYTPGNHEYYQCIRLGKTLDEVDLTLRAMCEEAGVVFLQKDAWTHPCGVTFLGCTLWSDVDAQGFARMNDSVRVFGAKWESNAVHNDHVAWLERALQEQKEKCVVMTHHLPTLRAVHERFLMGNNSGYASPLDRLLAPPVCAWLAGHTHEFASVTVNGTLVFVNPIGYPGERRATTYSDHIVAV